MFFLVLFVARKKRNCLQAQWALIRRDGRRIWRVPGMTRGDGLGVGRQDLGDFGWRFFGWLIGWWFGACLFCHIIIGNVIILIDEVILLRGVGIPPISWGFWMVIFFQEGTIKGAFGTFIFIPHIFPIQWGAVRSYEQSFPTIQ